VTEYYIHKKSETDKK